MKIKRLIIFLMFIYLLLLTACQTVCEKEGHNYNATSNNNGTHTLVCLNDAAHTVVEECSFREWVVVKEATLFEEGKEKRVCSKCSYKEERIIDPTHVHEYSDEWIIDKEATCKEVGYKSHHCINDGCTSKIDVTEVEKIEHSYGEWEVSIKETCEENGLETRKCSQCDFTDTRIVEALSHDEVKHGAKEPTCTEVGYNAYVTCSRCEYSTYKEIEKLEHKYSGKWTIDVAPTYENVGYKSHHCSNGNNCKTDITEIPMLPYSDGLVYKLNNTKDGYLVDEVDLLIESEVKITPIYNNLPVVGISYYAFENCRSLISIEIPSSITSIDTFAFYGCNNLENIIINNNAIYDSRDNCNAIIETATNTLLIGCKNTKIPSSVTSINTSAFYECSSLTSIEIPNSVTIIRGSAFRGCSSLTSIEIPNSVTSIGTHAFYKCSSLTNIEIPSSVTSIGDYAFSYCRSLTSVVIRNGLTFIRKNMFENCYKLVSVEIPSSVTSIGNSAFNGCSSLINIEIPSSITSIGDSAFNGCSSLINIEIPNSVTSIGNSVFNGCSSLISITIPFVGQYADGTGATNFGYIFGASDYSSNYAYVPSSLKEVIITGGTNIGESAFYGCSSLTTIVIPNSVESIGRTVLSGCSSLTSITIPYIGQYADGAGATNFGYLFGTTSYIKHSSYVPSSLKEVIITGGTSIENGAFFECSSLTSVVIANSIESIKSLSFYGCTNLTNIEIPNSVTCIGKYAFRDCTSLTIYCEVSIQPSEWDSSWNSSNCPVVWDYKKN